MATVIASMSMSLDGFVADITDNAQDVLEWYGNGDTEVPTATPGIVFRTSDVSAAHLRVAFDNAGAIVTGRRTFNLTAGWGGAHPIGVPTFVVSHAILRGWPDDSSIVFVTEGVAEAIERARDAAGDKWVAVASPDIARQCLDLGLLDEICVDLVPVLLGDGIPFLAALKRSPVWLSNPAVIEGDGVTHLRYRVKNS